MIAEPSAVLLETGEVFHISKEDGSAPATIKGILENAIAERQTGETTREAAEWQLTCATSEVAAYGEGDLISIGSDDYEILSTLAADPSFTIFLLSPL